MSICLFAFDTMSHFARNYSVQTKNGEPSGPYTHDSDGNPVYALKPTLLSINKEIRILNQMGIMHTHLVAVLDHPGKNFRHELFPDYKGNRPPKPDSWKYQETLLREYLESNGIPCIQKEGVEADDVLATLSCRLDEKRFKVVISTGDKDILSLCNDNISVYSGREKRLYDQAGVEEKFKVPCHRVLDYLAMLGDDADNVSGIAGIGGVTAPKVATRVSLDELLAYPGVLVDMKIRGGAKIAAWIEDNREKILLSQKLIALKKDVELGVNLRDYQVSS